MMRNSFLKLLDVNGARSKSRANIEIQALDYFKASFSFRPRVIYVSPCSFLRFVNHHLLLAPIEQEAKDLFLSLKSNTLPSPNSLTTNFKFHWLVVKLDVMKLFKYFMGRCTMRHLNSTFITLIPKGQTPIEIVHYHPISCTIVIYKVVPKLLANKMAKLLPMLLLKKQRMFVKGQNIADNSALVEEHLRGFD